MLPFLPPYMIKELANEFFQEDKVTRHATTRDPDGFFDNDSLQPDPVFMGLRAIVHTGPIGAVMRWIDGRIEAREDRIYGSPIEDAVTASTSTEHPSEIGTSKQDNQEERKIAA